MGWICADWAGRFLPKGHVGSLDQQPGTVQHRLVHANKRLSVRLSVFFLLFFQKQWSRWSPRPQRLAGSQAFPRTCSAVPQHTKAMRARGVGDKIVGTANF